MSIFNINNPYRKSKVHSIGTLEKTKKPSHFCEGFLLLAPSIGESYNFDAMVNYLSIRNINR